MKNENIKHTPNGRLDFNKVFRGKSTCIICGREIPRGEPHLHGMVSITDKEARDAILGEYTASNYLRINCHRECWKSLPRWLKRKLRSRDWEYIGLNVEDEVWVELDKNGKMMKKSIHSGLDKIDKKLRKYREGTCSDEEKKAIEEKYF